MIKKLSILLITAISFWSCATLKEGNNQKKADSFALNYDAPAKKWTEALPIGNGSLGAMIYGGVSQEHIQFNEETLWRGQPQAQKLAQEEFMSDPLKQIHYQPFADIYLDFPNHENFTEYTRTLNLDNAISEISYKINDVGCSHSKNRNGWCYNSKG